MPTPKLASTSYTDCRIWYTERQTISSDAQPPPMNRIQMILIVERTKKNSDPTQSHDPCSVFSTVKENEDNASLRKIQYIDTTPYLETSKNRENQSKLRQITPNALVSAACY